MSRNDKGKIPMNERGFWLKLKPLAGGVDCISGSAVEIQ